MLSLCQGVLQQDQPQQAFTHMPTGSVISGTINKLPTSRFLVKYFDQSKKSPCSLQNYKRNHTKGKFSNSLPDRFLTS